MGCCKDPQIAAYVNGILTQGMDVNHRELQFRPVKKGKSITCFFWYTWARLGDLSVKKSILRAVDEPVYSLYYDLLVPWQCLDLMEDDSEEYHDLLGILNETVNLLDFRTKGASEKSVKEVASYLRENKGTASIESDGFLYQSHTH